MTQVQTVANSGGDGNNVLNHPTHLHANDIRRGIDPKIWRAHGRLDVPCNIFMARRYRNGGRQAASDFNSECRTGQKGMSLLLRVTEDLSQDLPIVFRLSSSSPFVPHSTFVCEDT